MRRFYLHTRHHGVFYAELVTPDGLKLSARSTGTRNRDEALLMVAKWLEAGIPSGHQKKTRPVEIIGGIDAILKIIRKAELNGDDALRIVDVLRSRNLIDVPIVKAGKGIVAFTDFIKKFWDHDHSPYVREKLAHGQSIGKRHCYEMLNRVQLYWEPAFKNRPLNSVTRQDLKEFSLTLSDKGLAPASINKIMACGETALKWAFLEGMIPANPTVGLVRFAGAATKRGVLTPQEAESVFGVRWKDKRAYAGNLLSLTTGLRSGEVLALRKSDIGEKVLFVRHSWSPLDGLKCPKNGDERKVPLLPEVRKNLMELLAENPHDTNDPFVFYGLLEDKPMDNKILIDGLHDAIDTLNEKLEKNNLKDDKIDWKERGIVFHSHRHYFAARMADKMTVDQITRITGHKSQAVFEEYADHVINENLEVMAEAAAESFEKILKFPEQKGA